MQRDAKLVFGHGRFMCAEKTVAFMELNKILVEICVSTFPFDTREAGGGLQSNGDYMYETY